LNSDKLQIEILLDGTIKLTSDPISAPNHQNATEFFKTVARLSGGEVTTQKRSDAVHHHHTHEDEHEHQ